MRQQVAALTIIALVLVLLGTVIFIPYATSGYGGVRSTINDVNTPYPDKEIVTISGPVADVRYTGAEGVTYCGLRMELGQPQYTGDDLRYQNRFEQETDDGLLIREWEVRIAYFDMSWSITTDGGGPFAMTDVNFWIELKENEFDVFAAADEVEAYILEVVTTETVEISDPLSVKVSPAAEGFNFDLTAIEKEKIPDWMEDAGYQGVLSEFKHVKFRCTAESVAPQSIANLWRTEQGATWRTQVRVLVFGFWEVLSPYDDWEFTFYSWFDFLDDIFFGLEIIIGLAVGILLSAVILKFVPDKRLAVVILVVMWAVVFLAFGFMELFI